VTSFGIGRSPSKFFQQTIVNFVCRCFSAWCQNFGRNVRLGRIPQEISCGLAYKSTRKVGVDKSGNSKDSEKRLLKGVWKVILTQDTCREEKIQQVCIYTCYTPS
jgi:hypothetical protein